MKKLIILIFLFPTFLHATNLYKFRYWCNTESNWKYNWEESETPSNLCPTNASDSLDLNKTSILEVNLQDIKIDPVGVQSVKIESANPDFQAQWTSYSDHIDIASPSNNMRGFGKYACWDTNDDLYTVFPASATLSTAPGSWTSSMSAYQENSLNHHIFPGQLPIKDGWKRKRLRFLFMDIVNIREGHVAFEYGQGKRSRLSSYIFLRNLGQDPLQNPITPYNPGLAHNDATNPVGWCVTKYVDGIGMFGTDQENFFSEKSSKDLPFFSSPYPVMELWIEIDWDPNSPGLASQSHSGTGRAFIFRGKTIGN